MSTRRLIVGIGNPSQGLDGFGPAVVARLRGRAALPPDVLTIDAGTDLLSMLERFAEGGEVVLVDAFLADGSQRVTVVDEATFSEWDTASPSGHTFSAVLAIKLFRRLYPAAATRISLVGLDVARIASADTLPDTVVEDGVRTVLELLQVG